MKVLVVLTAALAWSILLDVEGTLIETVEEGPRGFFPSPFFPPYQQKTYSQGVYPFNAPPECFPQPVIPEVVPQPCPVCPVVESCQCEPQLYTCQTYSITVCPSLPKVEEVVEVVEEKVVDVQSSGPTIVEKQEVVEVTPEFTNSPSMFGPIGGFNPYNGFGQMVGGWPQFGGFPGQYGANNPVSAVRSLEDDQASSDNNIAAKNN